tara:strand:- start:269 stop:409 length:141 start_codon:yes stop_codon:yes gene_type:complete
MQKKIKKRYNNTITHKEYNVSDLPYTKYLEEKGVCAIMYFRKNSKK